MGELAKTYSLGEICHMVQLAVKVHHILGYRSGQIVPFDDSHEAEKLRRAEEHKACSVEESHDVERSWDMFRQRLRILLEGASAHQQKFGGFPMSGLKHNYKACFDLNLSETALGHTKLSTLLSDPRLEGVCRLERMGSEGILILA